MNLPPFKRKNTQFTVDEVFETKKIASFRIPVERSIGRVKKFHLFDGVLPLSLAPIASKCFKVASWLTNWMFQLYKLACWLKNLDVKNILLM